MKFDRNTVLGFVILAALFVGYFIVTSKEQNAVRKQREKEKAYQDSVIAANKPKQDPIKARQDSIYNDSVSKLKQAGQFQAGVTGTEELVTVENELIKVTFTTKGGQPKKVELKKYKGQDSGLVKLAATDFDKISYRINTGQGSSDETSNLFFAKPDVKKNADGSQVVSFLLQSSDSTGPGASITHEFIIKPNDYMVDFNVKMNQSDKLLTGGNMNLRWQYSAAQQESDITYEKRNTQVGYVEDGSFDYHTISKKSSKNFDESVKWIGARQRFFFTILMAKNNFSSGTMDWNIPPDTAKTIVQLTANMKLAVPAASATIPFGIYYGPSEYHILKKYDMKFEKLVNLGQGVYTFVQPINKFLIMPIFDFLKSIAGSMGLAIALLTLFIKLLTSPLLYKSYLSSAKMRVLRPDIAKLKEKFGADKQGMMVEQMKLFREAGVNQLGGCLPALLQIPIFFALFSLFNSDVDLRGASFLWSHDLAAYDQFIKFGVNIPILGSHLSLFNITAVITSFFISVYSMRNAPEQDNPVLKYMPYIFPVFLLFFFNTLPSALTWYYTVSNIITLLLQFIIQKYIINHDKIMEQIEHNRKKPKTKSKWQERMEQMQEQQKRMKELQQKNKR